MLSLSSILSSLFRLCSCIFLQVIPTPLAFPLLLVLYLLYLITAYEKHSFHRPISTIIFSLPTKSRYLQCLNLFINTLLFLATLDFAVTPFIDSASDLIFTRVGALYPDSAKIVVRYPKANATEHTLLLAYRETPSNSLESSPPWKDGPLLQLNQSFDWVGTVRLAGLWPGTSYECQSTCECSFLDPYSPSDILSDLNRTLLPYPHSPIQFRTFPDPRLQSGSRLRFITSSCMVPNFPYRGPFHRRTIRGYDLLATYLDSPTKMPKSTELPSYAAENQSSSPMKHPNLNPSPAVTDFLLFLGDLIYADVPRYIRGDEEAYRRLYRRNFQNPSFRNVYEKLRK